MRDALTLFLPYPPSANNLFPTGRSQRRFLSPEYRAWKADAYAALLRQKRHLIPGKVEVHYRVARPDHRRRDLANTQKALDDFLVEAGVIEDDRFIQRYSAEWDETRPAWGVLATVAPWQP